MDADKFAEAARECAAVMRETARIKADPKSTDYDVLWAHISEQRAFNRYENSLSNQQTLIAARRAASL